MKILILNDNEYKALEMFLEDYDNELSNRGCNDLPDNIRKLFTSAEGKAMAEEYRRINKQDLDNEYPKWPLFDSGLLDVLRRKMANSRLTKELIQKAINHLNEVRTGEDFEVECHTVASELKAALKGKPYDPDKYEDDND